MNAEQKALWRKIETTPLINADEDQLFQRKLAVQNGWSRDFTARCVSEYRKFVFLASASGHPVSPPDFVDQVWHLHLTYTRAYWKVFCPEVLGKPLHHCPSKGGAAEAQKFEDWYERSLQSYRSFFGAEPVDIWPAPSDKVAEDRALHQRVDARRYWIFPKPAWLATLLRMLLVGATLVMVVGCSRVGSQGPSGNVNGPVFLSLYAALLCAAFMLCRSARRRLTNSKGGFESGPPNLSLYEAAFLAGGARRMLQSMVIRFYEAGIATLDDDGKKIIPKAVSDKVLDVAETEAAECLRSGEKTWEQLREALRPRLGGIQQRLENVGLIVGSVEAWKVRAVCALIMGTVLASGGSRMWHAFTWEKPFGILLFLMTVGLVLTIWLLQRPFRTIAGDYALEELKSAFKQKRETAFRETSVLAGAPLALAVGLLGVSAVRGTPLEKLESKLGPESGVGCGGGCGGSSCGGGGCGGCGGCG